MHRRLFLPAILGLILSASFPARADFKLGRLTDKAVATASQDVVSPLPPETGPPINRNAAIVPRFKIARGFGRAIPLKFAARQIEPPAVAIRFGSGVDSATVVH